MTHDGYDELDDEAELEAEGAADDSALVSCPWCGEENEVALDPGGGRVQDYVEDCEVCCRPWQVHVEYLPDGAAIVSVEPADESGGDFE